MQRELCDWYILGESVHCASIRIAFVWPTVNFAHKGSERYNIFRQRGNHSTNRYPFKITQVSHISTCRQDKDKLA